MWGSVIIYALWTLHGLVTLLWAHRPVPAGTSSADDQEWVLYLQ